MDPLPPQKRRKFTLPSLGSYLKETVKKYGKYFKRSTDHMRGFKTTGGQEAIDHLQSWHLDASIEIWRIGL